MACRNLLIFPRGKERGPNLGIFLNAAGKDQPFGWQRRGIKFSLAVVNQLDASKSIVKGVPSTFHRRGNLIGRPDSGQAGRQSSQQQEWESVCSGAWDSRQGTELTVCKAGWASPGSWPRHSQ